MKAVVMLAALTVAPPVFAQTAPAASATAAPAAAPRFTLDTPVETIVADPAGKKALEDAIPGISTHESYEMFKAMSLRELQPMSGGQLSDEMMAKAKANLEAVK